MKNGFAEQLEKIAERSQECLRQSEEMLKTFSNACIMNDKQTAENARLTLHVLLDEVCDNTYAMIDAARRAGLPVEQTLQK